jgi:hypothetical protein
MNRDLVTALQIFFIYRSAKMCAASAVGIQHSETAANLFHVRSQSSGKTESVRLESVEPVLETDSALRWKVLSRYLKQTVPYDDAVAGVVIALQTFGDFLGFNSHLHVIATDGCFYGNGSFKACPRLNPKDLVGLFRYEVFKMLKSEGKINNVFIENMMNWRHRGFNVYYGNAIWFHNEEGLENLARYIIRASFSAKASLRASRADDIYSGK